MAKIIRLITYEAEPHILAQQLEISMGDGLCSFITFVDIRVQTIYSDIDPSTAGMARPATGISHLDESIRLSKEVTDLRDLLAQIRKDEADLKAQVERLRAQLRQEQGLLEQERGRADRLAAERMALQTELKKVLD